MSNVDERLSKIEAVQHFHTALIGALAKSCQDIPQFWQHARENLAVHHSILLGESTDENGLKAYEELMDEVLEGKP